MLENIKKLRIQSMKNRDMAARFAYEFVIAECQTFEAKVVNNKKNILNEKSFTKILKQEISKYNEIGRDKDEKGELIPLKPGETLEKQYEYDLLSALLPPEKVQLSTIEIIGLLDGKGFKNPKMAMAYLNELGYDDCYDKGYVAKFVLGKI